MMKSLLLAVLLVFVSFSSNAQQWENFQVVPWNDSLFINAVDFIDANTGCVGLYGIYRTTNAGETWTNVEPTLVVKDIKFFGQIGYATGSSGTGLIYKTTNGGLNWTQLWTGLQYGTDFFKIGLVNANTLFITGPTVGNGYKTLRRSTNGGASWDSIFSAWQPYLLFGTRMDGINYAVSQGNIYVNVSSDWFLYSMNITAHSDLAWNDGILYEGGQSNLDGVITRSTDQGRTWIPTILNSSDQAICTELKFRDDIGYAVGSQFTNSSTTGKIWKSLDGMEWNEIYSQSGSEFTDLSITERYVYFVGRGGNILRYDPSLTGNENEHGNVPKDFQLKQNYPNPFNPVTNINFDIVKNSTVKLTVFDVNGRELSVLVNEQLHPGSYKADWDASQYSSGIYFYKLETEDFVATKKMILIK